MTKYIDLEAAIQATCYNCAEINICNGDCDDTDRLREIPAADVVPVVRCGECEYHKEARVNKKGFLICPASGMEITDNDYCSYGARMEGDA